MAKYAVTHEDGRVTHVYASSELEAKQQANHAETSRIIIKGRLGLRPGPPPSLSVSVVKMKD